MGYKPTFSRGIMAGGFIEWSLSREVEREDWIFILYIRKKG